MNKQKVSLDDIRPVIEEQLHQGKEVTFRIKGNSMFPFLVSDLTDVTLVKPGDKCHKYDVVLFQTKDGKYIMHRIIKATETEYITMGDALKTKEKTTNKQIIGRMNSYTTLDKHVDCDAKLYIRKVKLWVFLRPFRRILLGLMRRINRSKIYE